MIIYEVTVTVEGDLVGIYEKYMIERHIPDVLITGYFVSAEMSRIGNKFRVQYRVESQEKLDAYLAADTERLRADFAAHFPTGVSVTREVWEVVAAFDGV